MSEAETKAAEAAPATASGYGKLLVVAGVTLAVLFAGGFALAYFILPARLAAAIRAELEASGQASHEVASPTNPGGHSESAGHGPGSSAANAHGTSTTAGQGAPSPAPTPLSFELKDVVVNVSGPRTGRFVRVSLAFDAPDSVLAELARQRARVTDVVSGILASKTEDELRAASARGNLRAEFVAAANALLSEGQVRNVFFLEYLIQP